MSKLMCPICSESLEEEGAHFYKHFRYKRYTCGTTPCGMQFYTDVERTKHCNEKSHKSCFQKLVNPYIDKVIAMIVEDARELTSKDMDTVLENRWGKPDPVPQKVNKLPSQPGSSEAKKKRTTPAATATPVIKKPRNGISSTATVATTAATVSSVLLNRSTATSTNSSMSRSIVLPTAVQSSPSIQPATNSTRAIVNSITPDNNTIPNEKPPTSSLMKKGNIADITGPQKAQSESASNNQSQVSNADAMKTWCDTNLAEVQNDVKIKCAVCDEEVAYDFVLRKDHAFLVHMVSDVDPSEKDDILKAAMDRCYPGLPNSNSACQMCGTSVRPERRRQHVEYNHVESIPLLMCPIEKCSVGFKRQWDLRKHMKQHEVNMTSHKDKGFQLIRRRRNLMITGLTKKCFPNMEVERQQKKEAKEEIEFNSSTVHPPLDSSLVGAVSSRKANNARRSSDNDSNDSGSDDEDGTMTMDAGCAEVIEQDIEFIRHVFNTEIKQHFAPKRVVHIKQEVPDEDDVASNDVPMAEAPAEPTAVNAPGEPMNMPTQNALPIRLVRVKEEPPNEDENENQSSSHQHSTGSPGSLQSSSFLSSYEPIVPAPYGSPDQMSSHVSISTRILSPIRTTDSSSRPSSRRFDNGKEPRYSRQENSTSSPYNFQRPSNGYRSSRGYSSFASGTSRNSGSASNRQHYSNNYNNNSSRRSSTERNSRSSPPTSSAYRQNRENRDDRTPRH